MTVGQVGRDAGPTPAVVSRLEYPRPEIVATVSVEGNVRGSGVVAGRFDATHPETIGYTPDVVT